MRGASFFDTLREASFRGAPFEVEDADESGGRRLARHEYPLRDLPFAEDLGRKAGEWRIQAFIIRGRKYDYAQARDDLRKALNAYGSGTLIHPWLGEMTVAVDRYSLRETTREGGCCEFDIDFVESGQRDNPSATTDTAAIVASGAAACRDSLSASFSFAYLPLPQELAQCLTALNDGAALVMDYLSLPQALISEGLVFAASLITTPLSLFNALTGLFGGLLGSLDAASALTLGFDLNILGGGRDEYGYFSYGARPAVPARNTAALEKLTAVNPVTAIAPATAIRRHLAQIAVVEDAAATASMTFDTADDALATRNVVLDGLDAVAPLVADQVFFGLSGLRLAVACDLSTRGGELPRVRRAVLPTTMPALAAAYRLHGDAGRADEIVSRNHIRHPGRVPGNTSLEVLSE